MPVCVAGQALGYRPGVRLQHLAMGQGMGPQAAVFSRPWTLAFTCCASVNMPFCVAGQALTCLFVLQARRWATGRACG